MRKYHPHWCANAARWIQTNDLSRQSCYGSKCPTTKSTNPATAHPQRAHYEELNVFGSPTGAVVRVREGDRLPGAPRSFTWRRIRRESC
jgi:hypothetical protein